MLRFKSGRLNNIEYQPIYKQLGIENQPKKQQTIVGRILLAKLLDLPIKHFIDNQEIAFAKHGKPYFKDRDIYFNIAHSDQLVLVAISNQQIGIDLEKIKPMKLKKIARAFTIGETGYLNTLSDPKLSEQILRLWTIKEAVLKEIGIGIPGKPKSVSAEIPHMDFASRQDEKFKINFLGVDPDYIGTLATKLNK